ncbi:hypothetical protein V6N12_066605 [Hibiscus sabdariffa]|uniref:Uncharacterized protein n=1 Tax=Hibiscus sabdariffa TaxID=183260 RepID=A0ABR2CRA2_9ROSI
MEKKFREIRVSIMSDFHKLLEIGLGMNISTKSINSTQDGVLGVQPTTHASGSAKLVEEAKNQTLPTLVIMVNDEGHQEMHITNPTPACNYSYKLICPKFEGRKCIVEVLLKLRPLHHYAYLPKLAIVDHKCF